ncbi:DUF2846 domain-containing protein [Lysobacter korlensis]|uniref:DUF2846 domain-containing protein n=1 Tax=Lysobacter korlensis TaxID=553636 RepID=A0ABV6RSL6_9GAMM
MRSLLSKATLAAVLLVPTLAFAQDAEPANTPTETAAAPAPAAAPAVQNTLIAPAPADKGQIVFFRESKMMGAAIGFKVREGETELGKLRSGKYFVATVEPGTHEYVVHGETKDKLTMEIEPGETYYVLGSLGMGLVAGRPNLSPSDEGTFMGMSKKLKLAK